jgi:hypothetical protein
MWTYAGHFDPEFCLAVCSELDDLLTLPKNWDGYGSPKISPTLVDAAKWFVRALPEHLAYRPRVVPMSPGNLQLEWQHGSKALELEFEPANSIRFLQWHPESGVSEEDTFALTDIDRAVELIRWFMDGTSAA